MKKLLVTGHQGLVGSACVEFFTEQGWEVFGIDNNGRSSFFGTPQKAISFAEMVDIRSEKMVHTVFEQDGPFDAIIHAAAQPSHDYATEHVIEDFEINARGTLNLLEATRKFSPDAVFVYVSTDKVYGENMRYPLIEDEYRYNPVGLFEGFHESLDLDLAGDRSFFGCSKAAADMYAQQYAVRFGMKVGIFRPGCITGKNHEGAEQHGFLAYLAKCIKEGKTYKIYGFKGKQVRDQIHASDLAKVFESFIRKPISGGVYNIGGGPDRSVSILEAGQLISKEMDEPFLYELADQRPGDRCWDVHDVSKFRKDYPSWEYKYSLQNIISDVCSK